MSDQDYFRLALGEIEDDLKNDFKSGLGFGLISELVINDQNVFKILISLAPIRIFFHWSGEIFLGILRAV